MNKLTLCSSCCLYAFNKRQSKALLDLAKFEPVQLLPHTCSSNPVTTVVLAENYYSLLQSSREPEEL